jgi:tRNA(adenine34) deaminase
MCAAAMIHGRISRLVFGTAEPKFGAAGSRFELLEDDRFNHRIEVTRGILEKECADVLKSFFKKRRMPKKSLDSELGVWRTRSSKDLLRTAN